MTDTGTTTSPAALHDLFGQFLDCDAHLYQEPDVMEALVGGAGGGYVLDLVRHYAESDRHREARVRAETDVWGIKGLSALGATEPRSRLRAMDMMGVRSQLLFPNTSLRELRMDGPAAREACGRYNDYAISWTTATRGRAQVVCQINMSDHGWAMAELERVVAAGACGVLLPCVKPPAGKSPANPIWDPFWRLLESSDTPALIHIGTGGVVSSDDPDDPMLPDRAWADAPTMRATFADVPGAEERVGPYFVVTAHLAAELYLTTLIMGGVFERFPGLRFGVIEFGAAWVGPLAERLDRHAGLMAKAGVAMPLAPSEYLRRNVRVTPQWVEPVDVLVQRHGLEEVYVFNTDYPHIEGGFHPIDSFVEMTERIGSEFTRAFFVDNATLLFPRIGAPADASGVTGPS